MTGDVTTSDRDEDQPSALRRNTTRKRNLSDEELLLQIGMF